MVQFDFLIRQARVECELSCFALEGSSNYLNHVGASRVPKPARQVDGIDSEAHFTLDSLVAQLFDIAGHVYELLRVTHVDD